MKHLDSCLPDLEQAAGPAKTGLSAEPYPSCQEKEIQQSVRLRFVTFIAKVAKAVEFLIFAVLRPADLAHWNRKHFEHFAGSVSSACPPEALSLNDDEKNVVARHFAGPGRALVLGCGEGREAIGFAKRGWEAVGVDCSSQLLASAGERARKLGLNIEWHSFDLVQGNLALKGLFNCITFLGQIYHYIPTRRLRLQTLNSCSRILAPGGICLFSALLIKPVSRARQRLHAFRLALAKWVGGNAECQAGDHWGLEHEYYYAFESFEEFADEVRTAGFRVLKNQGEGNPFFILLEKNKG